MDNHETEENRIEKRKIFGKISSEDLRSVDSNSSKKRKVDGGMRKEVGRFGDYLRQQMGREKIGELEKLLVLRRNVQRI